MAESSNTLGTEDIVETSSTLGPDTHMEASDCPGACRKIRQRLWDCLQRKQFCDVILEADDGEQVLAHRVVISAVSPVLYSMLMDEDLYTQDESGLQKLHVPEVIADCLRDIVRFAYLGNVETIRMQTVALWERFQIAETIILYECDPEPEPAPVPSYPEIKTEDPYDSGGADDDATDDAFQADDYVENDDENDDEDYVPPVEKTKSPPVEMQPESDSAESPTKGRRRKCSSPKHVVKRARFSPKTSYSSVNAGGSTAEIVPKKRGRPAKKIKASLTIITETKTDPTNEDGEPAIVWKTIMRRTAKKKTVPKKSKLKPVKAKPGSIQAFLCTTCNIQHPNQALYRAHREAMHQNGHKCSECDATFVRPQQLMLHRAAEHYKEGVPEPVWHRCTEEGCDYKTIYKYALGSHITGMHHKEKAICETCGAIFARPETLRVHVKRVHHGVGPKYQCDQCEKGFYSPSLLKAHHDRVHNKSKTHLCDQCPFMGFDRESIVAHMFRRHRVPLPGAKSSHTCPYCGYQSPSGSNMRDHIQRHEPQDYKCDQCDSVFPCSRDLRAHRTTNHSQKPRIIHHCPYEGCKYASKYGPSALRNHVSRMHEAKDFKPWACTICSYKTNVKGNLHLHLRNVHKLRPEVRQHRVHKLGETNNDPAPDPQPSDNPNAPITIIPAPAGISNNPSPAPTSSDHHMHTPPPTTMVDTQSREAEQHAAVVSNPLPVDFRDYHSPMAYQSMAGLQMGQLQGTTSYQTLQTAQLAPQRPLPVDIAMAAGQFGLAVPMPGYNNSQMTHSEQRL